MTTLDIFGQSFGLLVNHCVRLVLDMAICQFGFDANTDFIKQIGVML